jgi:sarcosine oxidase subunit gamma
MLTPRSALAGLLAPGRYGASVDGAPGAAIAERSGVAIVHVAARSGKADGVATIVAGIGTPIPLAPGEWLVLAEGANAQGSASDLERALDGVAAVIDLSPGKTVLRLSGARARDVLAKGCPLDLDARVFRTGDSATTIIAQITCTLRQVSDEPSYDLIVSRSFARSFLALLTASAAEYGYEIA